MDEAAVKAAILSYVRNANGRRKKPTITSEFSLGSSGVRADLVVFAETTIGFEIKTAQDSLRRLQSQMTAYSRYFDHAVAVVAPRHLRNLSAGHLAGASVWTYDEAGRISVLHTGIVNTVPSSALSDVLTQAERRKGDFAAAIQARYAETSRLFWQAVARRGIRAEDLQLLSRFVDGRQQAKRIAADKDAWWTQWLNAQGSLIAASA
jgi:hypothetical protein